MLFKNTPIGKIQVPEFEERKLVDLSDEELIEKAINENNHFTISPATYAMIEKRLLCRVLQQRIAPNIGFRHK